MQRVSLAVARTLHERFNITMVSYLDDWLIFSTEVIPVQDILLVIQDIGLQVNLQKSVLRPTTLGLPRSSHRDCFSENHSHASVYQPPSVSAGYCSTSQQARPTTNHGLPVLALLCHGLASLHCYNHPSALSLLGPLLAHLRLGT
jgi:hypothetical protein